MILATRDLDSLERYVFSVVILHNITNSLLVWALIKTGVVN
jgi:hypothetical protein